MNPRPALLFSANTLALFGEGLARFHPLTSRDRALPCFWVRAGPSDCPTLIPGEGPAFAYDPAMLALVEDVVRVLRACRPLAQSLFAPSDIEARLGFVSHASYAATRAFLAQRAALTEADDLRALLPVGDDTGEQTAARVRGMLACDDGTDPARRAYLRYLVDGGAAPRLTLRRLPLLQRLLGGTPATRFDPVQLRVLDLVVRVPEWLHRAEAALCMDDPTQDVHARWRRLLEACGVSEWAMESAAVRTWTHPAWAWAGSDPSPRGWWLLHRARRDVRAFVARHASLGRARVIETAFCASLAHWHAPRFAEVGAQLLATLGGEVPTSAISWALVVNRERVAALLEEHARVAFDTRSREDRAHLREMMRRK